MMIARSQRVPMTRIDCLSLKIIVNFEVPTNKARTYMLDLSLARTLHLNLHLLITVIKTEYWYSCLEWTFH